MAKQIKESVPFVTFYEKENISPVRQEISDLNKHYKRRESLFHSLGLPPILIKDKKILEFGPGSGHNAIYTASLSPSVYELVDGNTKGVQETKAQLKSSHDVKIKVHHSLFEDFKSNIKFDIVWAEGCLPHQGRPLQLLKKVSSFAREGGILCFTTINGVSYLSETLRRLIADRLFEHQLLDVPEQVQQLCTYFKPHLKTLRGMSRPNEDWILDTIIQPLQDRKLLSIPQAIDCLSDRFNMYQSSPRYSRDWRWYKEVEGAKPLHNENFVQSYYENNLNFLDYRFEFPSHPQEFGKKLEMLGSQTWDLMCKIQNGGGESCWDELFYVLDEICSRINDVAPQTTLAIREAVKLLQSVDINCELLHFPKWWGRGQQYLSLIRK